MGLWQVIHSNRREGREKRRLSTLLYHLSSLPQWKKLTLAIHQTAGSERAWNLSTNDPITVLSPKASFDISGLRFGSWKMEGFFKFEVRNWVLSLYGSRTKCFLCIDCIMYCRGIGERPTFRNMALCLSFVTLHKTWNLLEVLYSKLKWS